jgi:hypothetical protein
VTKTLEAAIDKLINTAYSTGYNAGAIENGTWNEQQRAEWDTRQKIDLAERKLARIELYMRLGETEITEIR